METVTDFIFLSSKITADDDSAMKLKDTCSLKKSYDQSRQHIKKQRHYFDNKGHLVKAMVFPIVTYGCESWTTNKAERWRTDAFKLWCWRRLLRVPWTARSNQPWILVGRTEAKAETPVFWSFHGNSWLIGKVPDAGKDLAQQKRCQRMRRLLASLMQWHEPGQTSGDGEGQEGLLCCSPWGGKESDVTG